MSEQVYSLTEEEIAATVAHVLNELADNVPPALTSAEVNLNGQVTEFVERGALVEWLEGAAAKDDAIHYFHDGMDKLDPDGD